MKTVALKSLGCKVNVYETEGMQQILQENGYAVVPFDAKADIYIVNTCSVTNIADHKSRQMLHRAKNMNPSAIVVAAGCYVQTGYETLAKDQAIDIIVGNNEKRNIADILRIYLKENGIWDSELKDPDGHRTSTSAGTGIPKGTNNKSSYVPDMSKVKEYEEMQVTTRSEHTRGFIKIQDGCNRFCTYCVIPYARGRIRSRKIEDVITEASALADGGCREIVLTGIHISSFGLDRGDSELLELIQRLNAVEKIERIRIGSLEPMIITDEFAEGLKNCEKLCPHFHLSLQSGSGSVLKRMNRHYSPDQYYEVVERLRRVYDRPAITTDVIVGFPGESEEEFAESYEFCRKVNFYEMHVFKYSKRDGTIAAGMADQIPEKEKALRSEKLIKLGNEMSVAYRRSHLTERKNVLFEEKKTVEGTEYWVGYTPEYIQVGVPAGQALQLENRLLPGKLDGFISDSLLSFDLK